METRFFAFPHTIRIRFRAKRDILLQAIGYGWVTSFLMKHRITCQGMPQWRQSPYSQKEQDQSKTWSCGQSQKGSRITYMVGKKSTIGVA